MCNLCNLWENDQMDKEVLLKTSEAAERLNVHPNTVLNLLQQNALRGTRLGTKTIRVYESSVEALLSTGAYGDAS